MSNVAARLGPVHVDKSVVPYNCMRRTNCGLRAERSEPARNLVQVVCKCLPVVHFKQKNENKIEISTMKQDHDYQLAI